MCTESITELLNLNKLLQQHFCLTNLDIANIIPKVCWHFRFKELLLPRINPVLELKGD